MGYVANFITFLAVKEVGDRLSFGHVTFSETQCIISIMVITETCPFPFYRTFGTRFFHRWRPLASRFASRQVVPVSSGNRLTEQCAMRSFRLTE